MPKRLIELPAATGDSAAPGFEPESADACATGRGVPLAAGIEAAIASMCALSAFAPNPVASVSLANCAMFESMLRRAFRRSSCPCSTEIRDCSAACSAWRARQLSRLASISAWIDARWSSSRLRSRLSDCSDAASSAACFALASLLNNSALARAKSNASFMILSAVWRFAYRISRSLGCLAACCWAPSVRYQSTVSSRICTTWSPVITARGCVALASG